MHVYSFMYLHIQFIYLFMYLLPLILLVFVLNHATPDDYQPAALKELHSLLAENFFGAKVTIAG